MTHRPSSGVDHIDVHWTGAGRVYDAALVPSAGVVKTSFGGSTRTELDAWSKPLVGVFRWTETTKDPHVLVQWAGEPGGETRTARIPLG